MHRRPLSVVAVLLVTAITLGAERLLADALDGSDRFFVAVLLRAVVLVSVPVTAVLAAREAPTAFGIGLGEPRHWAWMFLLALAVCLPLAVSSSRLPGAHALYPRYSPARTNVLAFLLSTLASGAQHLGWELLFRGFLLHGLARRFGRLAIVLQVIPFALVHLPKGLPETVLSIPGGLAFGWIAWRARSFVPTGLLHWSVATTVNLAVILWP